MSEIYDGSVEVSMGYESPGFDDIKKQVDDLLGPTGDPNQIADILRGPILTGLSHAGIWLANKAAKDAPILTGLLRQSGSVWLENKRIYITGGGTHPDQLDTGKLTAIIIFNTPYAFLQDSEPGYRHPRGGRSGYLTANFQENHKIIEEIMFAPLRSVFSNVQGQ